MRLPMALRVKQHEVFYRVYPAIRSPDNVVAMPLGDLGDLLTTNWGMATIRTYALSTIRAII